MKKQKRSRIFRLFCGTLAALLSVSALLFTILNYRTAQLFDSTEAFLSDARYEKALMLPHIQPVQQEISCGYAVIEMLSSYLSDTEISEKELLEQNGGISTSTSGNFKKELEKCFPSYKAEAHRYLSSSEFLKTAYLSLEKEIPVPFIWAAQNGKEWTLHYSLLIGMDVKSQQVTVLNPYGYEEELSFDALLERTSFQAYKKMPLYLNFAFALGIFEKNTLFILREK